MRKFEEKEKGKWVCIYHKKLYTFKILYIIGFVLYLFNMEGEVPLQFSKKVGTWQLMSGYLIYKLKNLKEKSGKQDFHHKFPTGSKTIIPSNSSHVGLHLRKEKALVRCYSSIGWH